MARPLLRIFLSSPGDVAEERHLAGRVVARLQREYQDLVELEAVLWEHEPLTATMGIQPQITNPSDCDIVVCILWARIGTRLPGEIRRPDGTIYESGTAYEFEDAVTSFRERGTPDLLVYQKTATPTLELNNEAEVLARLEQKRRLDTYLKQWFENVEEGTFIAPLHYFADSAQFEERLTLHLRKLIARRLPSQETARAQQLAPEITWTKGSPYRGLETFEPAHAEVFRGRTRTVGEVLRALRLQDAAGRAFVLVMGASGAGKSSLVRAGVLPLLTQPGVIEGVGLWRQTILRPADAGRDLIEGVALALLREGALPELASDGTTVAELTKMLRESPMAAVALVKGALSQAAATITLHEKLQQQPDSRFALVIDQMEELFTLERFTAEDRSQLSEILAALAKSGRVVIIATLRSDLYHRTQELQALAELKAGHGLYDLLPPDAGEIRQMIQEPAAAVGLTFEEHPESGIPLDEELVHAAVRQPGNLPLLEYTLQTLYEQRSGNEELTWASYEAMGGIGGAIAFRAEETFLSLPATIQAQFSPVFRALVTVGSGDDATVGRRSAPLELFKPGSEQRVLIDAFVTARLCTTDLDHAGRPVVTLAHEAMLRHWPRLQSWLEEDRELLRIKSRIEAATAQWLHDNRRPDLLLPSGKPLEEARFYVSVGGVLPGREQEFLNASMKQATRRRQLQRLGVAALATLAIVAVFSAVSAMKAQREAVASRLVSEELRLNGLAREAVLLSRQGDGAQARENLVEAIKGHPAKGAPAWYRWALWDVNRQHPIPLNEWNTGEGARTFDLSHDGTEALVPLGNSTFARVDTRTGRTLQAYPSGMNTFSARYALDETAIVTFGREDNSFRVWDLATGELLRTIHFPEVDPYRVFFSADGRQVGCGTGERHSVMVWDLATGALSGEYGGFGHTAYGGAISHSGKYIAGVGEIDDTTRYPELRIWESTSGRLLHAIPLPEGDTTFVAAFSPDDSLLATSGYTGKTRIWRTVTGALEFAHEAIGVTVDSLAFLPGGSTLIAQTRQDGAIRLFDAASGTLLRKYEGGDDGYVGLSLDRTGDHLLLAKDSGTYSLQRVGESTEIIPVEGARTGLLLRFDQSGRRVAGQVWEQPRGDSNWYGNWDAATGRLLRSVPDHDPGFRQGMDQGAIASDLDHGYELNLQDRPPQPALHSWRVTDFSSHTSAPVHVPVKGGYLTDFIVNFGGVAFAEKDELVISLVDMTLRAEDARTGEERWTVEIAPDIEGLASDYPAEPPVRLDGAIPGSTLVVLSFRPAGALALFDVQAKREIVRWQAHEGLLLGAVGITGNGRFLFSAGEGESTVRIWNVPEGTLASEFSTNLSSFENVATALSSDLRLFFCAANSTKAVELWDPATSKRVLRLETPADIVLASPDAQVVGVTYRQRTAQSELWPVGRVDTYLHLREALPPAFERFRADTPTAQDWKLLGDWYAYQTEWPWAFEFYDEAIAGGATVDPLVMGRCYWMNHQNAEAAEQFRQAIAAATDPDERDYLTRCLAAIEHPPVIPTEESNGP